MGRRWAGGHGSLWSTTMAVVVLGALVTTAGTSQPGDGSSHSVAVRTTVAEIDTMRFSAGTTRRQLLQDGGSV